MADKLKNSVQRLLDTNWIEGRRGRDRFGYTRPSVNGPKFYRSGYQQQWFWDSCFHAIMNARYFDPERAKTEIRSLINANRGRHVLIGAVSFWNAPQLDALDWLFVKLGGRRRKLSSAFTQPPMIAMAVEEIYERTGDKEFLAEIVPRIADHFLYLKLSRDVSKDGLIKLIHPLESGTDARPDFFPALRIHRFKKLLSPFRFFLKSTFVGIRFYLVGGKESRVLGRGGFGSGVLELLLAGFDFEDPLFNSIYVQNLRALARLYGHLGQERLRELHDSQADKSEQAIIDLLWHEHDGLFYGRYGRRHRTARVKTVASLAPLILDNLPSEYSQELVAHLVNPEEFATTFPVPSCAADEPAFQPKESFLVQLWRGPSWLATNWLLYHGLIKHGYSDEAREIGRRTIAMVETGGLREYYNPLTGEGYGAKEFGWSTLAYDIEHDLARRFKGTPKSGSIAKPNREPSDGK